MASTETNARLSGQSIIDEAPPIVACLVELPEAEAYALAQLCKRITWSDCMTLSVDRDECQRQINATNRVRDALARCGVVVR